MPALSSSSPVAATRDASIDALRGAVMCLMVLDHVRDFFTSVPFYATDADKTYAALFFTRWVTHFCAPVFVLLAGTGAGISRARGKSAADLARFLVTRGLWLVLLEVTWVRFGWLFELSYQRTTCQVIWALGWCMVVLAALVFLPRLLIGAVGFVLVAGHNAFDAVTPEHLASHLGGGAWIWRVLHAGGPIELAPGHILYIAYPLVPWIGVMALGYVLGQSWSRVSSRSLLSIGAGLMIGFVCLRLLGLYGDPHPFMARSGIRSVFAFLDCEKYPPSLEYLLMTLGPALMVLGALRGRALDHPLGRLLVVFGRVPLAFYLLHLPLAHLLSVPLRASRGLPLFQSQWHHGLDVSLPIVYAMALLTIAILYWPCRRWMLLKSTRSDWWLSYL